MSDQPVTHAALMAANPTGGIVPPECRGAVTLLADLPDDDPMGGPTVRVQVWACPACGTRVSLDATNRRILNTYRWFEPADLVGGLARSFDPDRAKAQGGGA